MKLHSLIGVIDNYGSLSCLSIFQEDDGTFSQQYPGHYYIRNALMHKRWRWLVAGNKLDRSALMDWEPDVEELDKIEQLAASKIKWYTQDSNDSTLLD